MPVVSVAVYAENAEIKNAILTSDYIRSETLRRCYAIPSYSTKTLRWKNEYYALIKRRVTAEVEKARLT